jgi:hypothetical protein
MSLSAAKELHMLLVATSMAIALLFAILVAAGLVALVREIRHTHDSSE